MLDGQQGAMMQGVVMMPMMRTDTVPVMLPPNQVMAQAVPMAPVVQVAQP